MNFWHLIALVMMAVSAKCWMTFKRYQGWYESTIGSFFNDDEESSVPDRIICEWQCANNVDCYGVTFNHTDSSCIEIFRRSTLVYTGNMADEISIKKWQKVYQLYDSTVDISNWTVDAAKALCESLDFRLVTYSELDNAYHTDGYYTYDCGYVEGGITTAPKSYISSYQTVRMANCSLEYANVFCRDP